MSAASKYIPHYTVADYRDWEGDWELWSGIPVAMSPSPFGRHQAIASRVAFALRRQILESGCRAEVLHEIDWIIAVDTVVRPDVLICCDGVPDRHVESPPSLIVEVLSDATRERDLTHKRDLYRDNGVATYLAIDPETNIVLMWERDSRNEWIHSQPSSQMKIRVCEDCELIVDCQTFFP